MPEVIWSSNSITPVQSSRALLCECSGVNYAVAAEHILEVIELPAVNAVAGGPVWFDGLAVYKARPVPVIDIGRYFDFGFDHNLSQNISKLTQSRAIVVQLAGSTYLLAADKILNLAELPSDHANSPASSSNVPDLAEHRAIDRVCDYDNKLVALINLPELLRLTKFLRECKVV